MKKLSIIVPCYNEEKNIPLILERFDSVLQGMNAIEVILVNNGSTDFSEEVFDRLCNQYPFAKRTRLMVNQGYGYGVLQGLTVATGDYLGWTHADMQTDPNDVVRAYQILKNHDFPQDGLIKGTRQGRSWFDEFFTMGMSAFETLYLKKKLWDINAQPNIFHRSFFEQWKNPPHDFSLDLYALYMARKMNLKIIRFPVLFSQRQYGVSSWNTGLKAKYKFIKRTIQFSYSLKKELDSSCD